MASTHYYKHLKVEACHFNKSEWGIQAPCHSAAGTRIADVMKKDSVFSQHLFDRPMGEEEHLFGFYSM